MTWILTSTGKQFDPLDPNPSQICIEDIAAALSRMPRWAGHTGPFFSVAEHSVYVSQLCPPEDALAGLLHDASEAYLMDIPHPIKMSPVMAGYREAEKRLQQAIATSYGLPSIEPASVKRLDDQMKWVEGQQLFHPPHPRWESMPEEIDPRVANLRLVGYHPDEAYRFFMDRWMELGGPLTIYQQEPDLMRAIP